MKKYFLIAKEYVIDHKKQFTMGTIVVLGIAVVVLGLALYSYNTRAPKVLYEPATACQLLTPAEAKTFLGDATINGISTPPAQTGNVADSQCSYSDGKPDTANAVVIALNIRSGINDAGVAANKDGFAAAKAVSGTEVVNNIGDAAFYNPANGQLNILKETTWILLSYGPGADPASNKLEEVEKVADKVLNQQ